MKRIRFLSVVTAIVIMCAALSSCSNVTIKYDGSGKYTDSKNGVTYTALPSAYEPVASGEKYATLKIGKEKLDLFIVKDLDPTVGLCDKDGQMFFNIDTKVPTLDRFNPNKFYVCKTVILTAAIAEVTDISAVMRLAEQYLLGEGTMYQANEVLRSFFVKFASADNPALFYNLTYLEYEDDICRYVDIDDPETYVSDVSDSRIKLTFEQTPKVKVDENGRIVTDGNGKPVYETNEKGEQIMCWSAVYNYGRNFLYDRETGRFVPVWNLVNAYL